VINDYWALRVVHKSTIHFTIKGSKSMLTSQDVDNMNASALDENCSLDMSDPRKICKNRKEKLVS